MTDPKNQAGFWSLNNNRLSLSSSVYPYLIIAVSFLSIIQIMTVHHSQGGRGQT